MATILIGGCEGGGEVDRSCGLEGFGLDNLSTVDSCAFVSFSATISLLVCVLGADNLNRTPTFGGGFASASADRVFCSLLIEASPSTSAAEASESFQAKLAGLSGITPVYSSVGQASASSKSNTAALFSCWTA